MKFSVLQRLPKKWKDTRVFWVFIALGIYNFGFWRVIVAKKREIGHMFAYGLMPRLWAGHRRAGQRHACGPAGRRAGLSRS